MTHVMGLDVSLTSTGVIVLSESGGISDQAAVKSEFTGSSVPARMARIEKITRDIRHIVKHFQPAVICIEAYTHSHNQPGLAERIELGGLLRYALWREDCATIWEVASTTLKKWATGKGNAPGKTPMVVALMKRYGVEFQTDDEYDAYGLARMALQIAGLDEPATAEQKAAIETVITPKVKKAKKSRPRA